MNRRPATLAGLAAMLALILAPSAVAGDPPDTGPGAKAKHYAKLCGATARHRHDTAGCVRAMKKLATGKRSSPRSACAGLSRRRIAGRRGPSAFGRCVKAGAKLVKERKAAARDAADRADEQAAERVEDAGSEQADGEDDDPLIDAWLDGGVDLDRDDVLDVIDPQIDVPGLP
jgi:hypothetical protein